MLKLMRSGSWLVSSGLLSLAVANRRRQRGTLYVLATLLAGALSPLLAGGIGLAIGYGGLLLITGSTRTDGLPPALVTTAGLALAFGPIFLFVHLWLLAFEGRPLWTVGLATGGAARYGRGWIIGVALFAAPVAAMAATAMLLPADQRSPAVGFAALPGVALVVLGWAVQGAGEEVLTRGLMLQTVSVRFGPIAGVAVSSAVFAALHSLNAHLTALALANLFLFGAFAALFALREGSLWGVCAIHAAWNWAEGQLFGLAVSGGAVPGGSLLAMRLAGPDLVTGGAFGPEGGLAVTVALALAIALVAFLPSRQAGGS